MTALIFANGPAPLSPLLDSLLTETMLVVAADGGAAHCLLKNRIPDVLLGDFDSIELQILQRCRQANCEIIAHPVDKDATDLELALSLVQERGHQDIWIISALGARWDMSLGNLLLAAHPRYAKLRITFLGDDCLVDLLRPGTHILQGHPGQTISLLPLSPLVEGITLHGFRYPLNDTNVVFGSSHTMSNVLLEAQGEVTLSTGLLLSFRLGPKRL